MPKEPITLRSFDLEKEFPQVLLLGNGPCISTGGPSCQKMMEDVINHYESGYTKEQLENLSFPMQVVAASKNNVKDVCQAMHKSMTDPESYQMDLQLFQDFLSLPMDAFLTTFHSITSTQ